MKFSDILESWRSSDEVAKCEHKNVGLCQRTIRGGARVLQKQCFDCGASVGGQISRSAVSKEEFDALPEWNLCFEDAEFQEKIRRWHNERPLRKEDAHRRLQAEYEAYRATPEWKKKRDAVILRAQGICEGCRERPAEDVHHTTYANFKHEFLFELVAVCRQCHESYHCVGDYAPRSKSPERPLTSSHRSEAAPEQRQGGDPF